MTITECILFILSYGVIISLMVALFNMVNNRIIKSAIVIITVMLIVLKTLLKIWN
mgnify:CR=1 FL=1